MKKLVAYITTGYPDIDFTKELALSLKESGVDIIELGIPFSDPVADGEIIERANLLSLQNGFKIKQLFEVSKVVAKEIDTLFMGYFNPFYHIGIEKFINKAKESGVNGFIIPDLPYEEALKYRESFKKKELHLIDFVAPTDTKERIEKIVKESSKFIYLVAYAGITGSGADEDLREVISNIREFSSTDIYIGFGVNQKTAKEKAKGVDGVIVGSAFIKILLDNSLSKSKKINRCSELAKIIKEEIN